MDSCGTNAAFRANSACLAHDAEDADRLWSGHLPPSRRPSLRTQPISIARYFYCRLGASPNAHQARLLTNDFAHLIRPDLRVVLRNDGRRLGDRLHL